MKRNKIRVITGWIKWWLNRGIRVEAELLIGGGDREKMKGRCASFRLLASGFLLSNLDVYCVSGHKIGVVELVALATSTDAIQEKEEEDIYDDD